MELKGIRVQAGRPALTQVKKGSNRLKYTRESGDEVKEFRTPQVSISVLWAVLAHPPSLGYYFEVAGFELFSLSPELQALSTEKLPS